MKRFRFPEQALLTLRQQEKRAAEAAVMRASRTVTTIEHEIDSLQRWLLNAMQALASNTASGNSPSQENANKWRSIHSIREAQRQLAQSIDLLSAANQTLEQARSDLRNAEISLETLETLKKNRFADHRRMWQAKQQQLSDESTMRMWMKRQHEVAADD